MSIMLPQLNVAQSCATCKYSSFYKDKNNNRRKSMVGYCFLVSGKPPEVKTKLLSCYNLSLYSSNGKFFTIHCNQDFKRFCEENKGLPTKQNWLDSVYKSLNYSYSGNQNFIQKYIDRYIKYYDEMLDRVNWIYQNKNSIRKCHRQNHCDAWVLDETKEPIAKAMVKSKKYQFGNEIF